MTQKAQAIKAKIKKWDYINIKTLHTAKEKISKMNRKPMKWKKIF